MLVIDTAIQFAGLDFRISPSNFETQKKPASWLCSLDSKLDIKTKQKKLMINYK